MFPKKPFAVGQKSRTPNQNRDCREMKERKNQSLCQLLSLASVSPVKGGGCETQESRLNQGVLFSELKSQIHSRVSGARGHPRVRVVWL